MVSHAHQGTTSSALTRLNVKAAHLVGVPRHTYAHLLGLAREHLDDDACRTPAASIIRVLELTTGQVSWTEASLLMAQESAIGTLGVWDYLITSAATPLEGIRDAAAYLSTVLDTRTDSLRITEDGDRITLSHINESDLSHAAACAVRSYALGVYQRRLAEAARRDLVPVHVALAAETPRRHDALTRMYGTRAIEFEAPVSSITFLASDLKAPNPHAQPGLSAVLRDHADRTLASAIPLRDWMDLFRAALVSAHDERTPALPDVARRLALSTRTLQRRLDEHGTTWSDEVEAVRRAHITHLLHDTDLTFDAVATRSGYADARALRRAVHRWYGTTPATLRRAGRLHTGQVY